MTDLVATPRDKSFVAMLDIVQHTGRAIFTTPDVPRDRLDALRSAFDATMVDPAFVDQMTKLNFDLRPVKGDVVQAGIERVITERDSVMPQLKALLSLD